MEPWNWTGLLFGAGAEGAKHVGILITCPGNAIFVDLWGFIDNIGTSLDWVILANFWHLIGIIMELFFV